MNYFYSSKTEKRDGKKCVYLFLYHVDIDDEQLKDSPTWQYNRTGESFLKGCTTGYIS